MSGPDRRIGPYETRDEATADARLTRALVNMGQYNSTYAVNIFRMREELHHAGVAMGHYDRDVIDSLALNTPELTQVLIGIIARAYESGWQRGYGDGTSP